MDHLEMMSWAERHLQSVEASAQEFMRKDPYITFCQPDFKRRTADTLEYAFTVQRRRPVEPHPEHIKFQIGDTLHALRVSLDYLAVHAVVKEDPLVDQAKVAFPISVNESDFRSRKGHRLANVSPELVEVFKAAQPCFGLYRDNPSTDPLAILDSLEQPHKHRRLLSADPGVYDVVPGIVGDPRFAKCLHVTVPTQPLGKHDQAEVARFEVGMDGNEPKAKVYGNIRFFVCFDREGPALGAPAITMLKKIRDHIRDEIFPLFKDFV